MGDRGEDRGRSRRWREPTASVLPTATLYPVQSARRDLTVIMPAPPAASVASRRRRRSTSEVPFSVTADRASDRRGPRRRPEQSPRRLAAKSTPAWLSARRRKSPSTQPRADLADARRPGQGRGAVLARQLAQLERTPRAMCGASCRTIGTAVDRAVITGSGAGGQPTGILNTAGIQTQSTAPRSPLAATR